MPSENLIICNSNMAAGEMEMEPLKNGSILSVTVDQALPTAIIVTYRHGHRKFQGALVNSPLTDVPLGIDITRERIEEANCPLHPPDAPLHDPNHDPGKLHISSTALRHTYLLDPNAVNPKCLPPPPKKDFTKAQSSRRNVRNMKLRPRKVLCSNCKQALHDNNPPVKNVTTRSSAKQAIEKANAEPVANAATAPPNPEAEPGSVPPPRKVRKEEKSNDDSTKKVPVLKLSLPRPSAKGDTVITIPKVVTLRGQENDDPKSSSPMLNHEEYHKRRKALKKAKMKEKLKKSMNVDPSDNLLAENGHHKKNKHGKHKVKRKHKHKDAELNEENKPGEIAGADNFEPKPPQTSQKKDDDFEFDSGEKFAISNAGEFTNLKNSTCVVRLEKLDIEQQGVSQNAESEESLESKSSPISESLSSPENEQGNAEPSSSYQVQVSDISDPEDEIPTSPVNSYHHNTSHHHPVGTAAGVLPYAAPFSTALPLIMPIQTRNILQANVGNGRVFNVNDVVWGKIIGYPWWPGRIVEITQSLKDDIVVSTMSRISWFASSTMSYIDCYELFPFFEYFKDYHSRRKKGLYRIAIKQATEAAKQIAIQSGSYVEGTIFDIDDAESFEYDGLTDIDDLSSYQNLEKENVDSLDSQGMMGYDELKPMRDENVVTTPTQTPTRIGKSDSLNEEIQQFNNMESLESYSRQLQDDLNNGEV